MLYCSMAVIFSYIYNPTPGVWGNIVSVDEQGKHTFNGIIDHVAAKEYDTSVAGLSYSLGRTNVVDFPISVVDIDIKVYVQMPKEGKVTIQAYTKEFTVRLNYMQR